MTLQSSDLIQFSGTEQYYFHPLFKNYPYTDGVQYVAQTGGAYWLIEAIFSWQVKPKVRAEEFQHWTLTVKDNSAVLKATDGNGNAIARQKIEFTDFPLREISFYLIDKVLLLTSEY